MQFSNMLWNETRLCKMVPCAHALQDARHPGRAGAPGLQLENHWRVHGGQVQGYVFGGVLATCMTWYTRTWDTDILHLARSHAVGILDDMAKLSSGKAVCTPVTKGKRGGGGAICSALRAHY